MRLSHDPARATETTRCPPGPKHCGCGHPVDSASFLSGLGWWLGEDESAAVPGTQHADHRHTQLYPPLGPTTRGLNPAPKLASVGPAGAFLSLGLCGYSLCRARRPQFLTAHGGGGRVGRDIGFRPQVPFQLCHFAQDDREKPHKTDLAPHWGHSFSPAPTCLSCSLSALGMQLSGRGLSST